MMAVRLIICSGSPFAPCQWYTQSTCVFWREGGLGTSPSRVMVHYHNQRQTPGSTLYLSLARSNDGRKPAALPGVHQQEDHIMALDELLQLLHILAGLLQGDAGEVHWMPRHGDAHVEPSGILGKHPHIEMSQVEV